MNSYDFALGSHAHPGWALSKEGRYRADFTHTFDGRSVKASLHFAVGKTPLPAIQDCGDNPIGTKQARPDVGPGDNASGGLPLPAPMSASSR